MTSRLDVAEAYARWATHYDQTDNPLIALCELAAPIEWPDVRGKDVVEAGCGTGRNLVRLREAGARSVGGFDLSPEMLAEARVKLGADGAGLATGRLDARWPLPDGCADLVLFALVLEHVGDLRAAFSEAFRVVRPGGRALVMELHDDRLRAGFRANFRVDGHEFSTDSHAHTLADYRAALEAAGFSVERETVWSVTPALTRVSRKFERHLGKPFLTVVHAVA